MNRKDELKKDILIKVKEYYQCVHKETDEFVPGETRINYAGRFFDEHEMMNLIDSSLEFWLTYGKYSRSFEQRLAEYLEVGRAFLVNSGSSANLLAFMALTCPELKERRILRGDEVITVAAGFPTTVAPIIQYGAVPVFIDIGLETLNADISQLESALSERTRAVMLAHTLGNPFDIAAVKEFCERHGLWLIEDNCDALGSKYDGRLTGSFGDIGTSSFYPPHHLTMGEGGAVYTSDPLLEKIMASLRDWGRDCSCESGKDDTCGCRFTGQFGTLPFGYDHKYVFSHFGYNLKVTDLQASIGCSQLGKVDFFAKKRKHNFQYLYDGLKECQDVFLLPQATEKGDPSWFGFFLTLRDHVDFSRNDIVGFLESRNIQTRNLFAGNITRHPCFEPLTQGEDYRVVGDLKITDKVMTDGFWVGVYPGMTAAKLDFIILSIKEFLSKNHSS